MSRKVLRTKASLNVLVHFPAADRGHCRDVKADLVLTPSLRSLPAAWLLESLIPQDSKQGEDAAGDQPPNPNEDYPPQLHAGKVGYGPEYGKGAVSFSSPCDLGQRLIFGIRIWGTK